MKRSLAIALLVASLGAPAFAKSTTVSVQRSEQIATFKFHGPTAREAASRLQSLAVSNRLNASPVKRNFFTGTVKVTVVPTHDAHMTLGALHEEAPHIAADTDQDSINRNSF